MPVYNTEKYLPKAIESVLKQTYRDFELLLIDDCSNDQSGIICDQFLKIDKHIEVTHFSENKGLSAVRNRGIDEAKGEYITFIDSDDFVEPNLLEKVAGSLLRNKAQVIMYGFVEDYYDMNDQLYSSVLVQYPAKVFKTSNCLRKEIIHIEEQTLYGYVCNKFYNLNYLKSIHLQFKMKALIEDIEFNVAYFMKINSLNILNFTPYHYCKRINHSLTNQFVPEYFQMHEQRIKMILNQYKYWKLCTTEVKTILANRYLRYVTSALQRNCDSRSNMDHSKRKKWLKDRYQSDMYLELHDFICPKKFFSRVLGIAFCNRWTEVYLLYARIIYIIRCHFPLLFAREKLNS